jgi:hypothetical protein
MPFLEPAPTPASRYADFSVSARSAAAWAWARFLLA